MAAESQVWGGQVNVSWCPGILPPGADQGRGKGQISGSIFVGTVYFYHVPTLTRLCCQQTRSCSLWAQHLTPCSSLGKPGDMSCPILQVAQAQQPTCAGFYLRDFTPFRKTAGGRGVLLEVRPHCQITSCYWLQIKLDFFICWKYKDDIFPLP